MRKNTLKLAAIALLTGTVFQIGGCLGPVFQSFIRTAPVYGLMEFLLDNDTTTFDLFEDGNVTAPA